MERRAARSLTTYLAWAAVLLAVLVHLPALGAPFMLDDYAQGAMAEGRFGAPRGPFELYDYIGDANRARLFDLGAIPWWTDGHLVVRFFRPLSSALVWLDHRAFGPDPLPHHVHSLLWWAAAALGVHALLRRAFRPRPALLGALAFAFAPAHALPLVWLANRDVLVSTALGVWALVAYVRFREGRRARDGAWSLLLFTLAVLAGEYTLCFAGYVVAMEATRRREGIARRALGLSVFVLPVAAYLALHFALGYDARGSGFYRNPLHDFPAYALGAPRRLAILVGSAWLGADDSWTTSNGWALAGLGLGTIAVLALPVARVIRGLEEDERRRAIWMLAGSVLALAPVLSVEAAKRLLDVAMIGVCGVVGLVVDRAWFHPVPEPRRGMVELTGLVALALGFAHFVRGPLDTLAITRATVRSSRVYADRIGWLRDHVDGRGKTVMIVRADSAETALWGPYLLREHPADRWRVLSFASGRSLLLRTGPRSLELVQSDRPLFHVGPDDLFRNIDELRAGDAIDVPGMHATLVQLDEHQMPKRLRFELDRDLDDPSLQWITEGDDGFREEKLPPPGYGSPVPP